MIHLPTAVGMFLCDDVVVDVTTKSVSLRNSFTELVVDGFPSPPQAIQVFVALTGGLGDARIELLLHRLDTFDEILRAEKTIQFTDRFQDVRAIFRSTKCIFPVPGIYQFSLRVDRELIAQRRLRLRSKGGSHGQSSSGSPTGGEQPG